MAPAQGPLRSRPRGDGDPVDLKVDARRRRGVGAGGVSVAAGAGLGLEVELHPLGRDMAAADRRPRVPVERVDEPPRRPSHAHHVPAAEVASDRTCDRPVARAVVQRRRHVRAVWPVAPGFGEGHSHFTLVDLGVAYLHPNRHFAVSLECLNCTDQQFTFQDDSYRTTTPETSTTSIVPVRTLFLKATLKF